MGLDFDSAHDQSDMALQYKSVLCPHHPHHPHAKASINHWSLVYSLEAHYQYNICYAAVTEQQLREEYSAVLEVAGSHLRRVLFYTKEMIKCNAEVDW
jgi:hypothetical protein